MPKKVPANGNRVLSRLSRADLALLQPHLGPLDLPLLKTLETRSSRIDTVYFIDRGFASVVADAQGKREIEVGIIGREGMTGLAVVLGQDHAQHASYIQMAGVGHGISAARLRQAMAQSASLHQTLLHCAHAFLTQTSETAVANGRSKTKERLARWLLMAHDRSDGRELPLTHTLLAIMLGVQRPAVSVAVEALERQGLLRAGRRVITILDRKGLVAASNGAYERPDGL